MNHEEKPSQETLDKWYKDPNNWKLGIFYFNKEDKRIFPPKKFKSFGWTVNFANPLSIGVFAVLFIVVLVLIRYLKSIN